MYDERMFIERKMKNEKKNTKTKTKTKRLFGVEHFIIFCHESHSQKKSTGKQRTVSSNRKQTIETEAQNKNDIVNELIS